MLDHVPVRAFGDDQCGPGSLSIVLNALGDAVSEQELAATLPRAPGGEFFRWTFSSPPDSAASRPHSSRETKARCDTRSRRAVPSSSC